MKKIVGFFAMALALVACSQMNEIQMQPEGNEIKDGIVINAVLAPKDAVTKAVAEDGNKIVVSWAVNEHIAIVYEPTVGNYQVADATITSVDGSGAAHITFTVASGTPDDAPCSIVYPYSAAQAANPAVKDVATLIGAQNGTLNANLDVRVGKGLIKTATPSLNVTTQPLPQFAIFKFGLWNVINSTAVNVNSLTISLDGKNYVITPGSPTNVLYAALPEAYGNDITFTAEGSDSKTYKRSRTGATFSAGNFYQSNIMLYKNGSEQSEAFDTKTPDQKVYESSHFTITGTACDKDGLFIDKNGGENHSITITAKSGEIISRVEFHCGEGEPFASYTTVTRGTVHWANGKEYGSIEGIYANSFMIQSNYDGGEECVQLNHIVVYYMPAPAMESINTNGSTSYETAHFIISGSKCDGDGLRVDANGGQNTITITAKSSNVTIAKVVFHCTTGKPAAVNTNSSYGKVIWDPSDDDGSITGVNSTQVEITNTNTSIFVQFNHIDVFYYTE